MKAILDRFFQPKTIAVFGATDKPEKVSCAILQNLKSFEGKVLGVNPKYTTVMGFPCYKNAKSLPLVPDLAIIATPAPTVPALIGEIGKKGIRAALVISAGFKEAGAAGEKLHRELMFAADKHKVRIIGPNCMGLLTPALSLNATFSPSIPPPGRVAFISQSGAIGSAILDWAASKKVGFSYFASVGSMSDIGFDQLIDYFASDSHTACILIYMESLHNARKFLSAARAFARSKPIVVLKAGASAEGARAALSHTGAMAGNDAVYDAAFKRAGIIRVNGIQQLFDCAQALATQPLPAGNRLAIVTNAGGPAILATDALMKLGGTLSTLSPETIQSLNNALPPAWSKGNPVDVLGDARAEQFRAALRACLFDPNVDAVLTILTAQSITDPTGVAEAVVAESRAVFGKPVYASWMGLEHVRKGREVLENGKVPWFPFPERAVDVFMRMVNYRENLEMLYETPADLPIEFPDIRRDEARAIVAKAQNENRVNLDEQESKNLLACYGIPVNTGRIVKTSAALSAALKETGFPVVMKIESPDIWHKTDVGGVWLDIANETEAQNAFHIMLENIRRRRPDARIEGVLVEKMMKVEHEVLIGSIKDPVFGPVIVFGLGGTATEVWKDRTIGLPPLNLALARHLVEGTTVSKLLHGFRHLPAAPLEMLQTVLCRFAYLLMDIPDLREFDINPFAMNASGGMALDAAGTLEHNPTRQREPYDHLSILPYPTQWQKTITLRNGVNALLRPIRPEDELMEGELVKLTSRDSLYFRFFGIVSGMDHKFLSRMTHIDYDREIVIVAEIEQDGWKQIIGEVRIVGDGWRESAEYAILVTDSWQNLGLGGALTDFIIDIARQQGYQTIHASFLKSNGNMRRMFVKKGFKMVGGDEDSNWARLEL